MKDGDTFEVYLPVAVTLRYQADTDSFMLEGAEMDSEGAPWMYSGEPSKYASIWDGEDWIIDERLDDEATSSLIMLLKFGMIRATSVDPEPEPR